MGTTRLTRFWFCTRTPQSHPLLCDASSWRPLFVPRWQRFHSRSNVPRLSANRNISHHCRRQQVDKPIDVGYINVGQHPSSIFWKHKRSHIPPDSSFQHYCAQSDAAQVESKHLPLFKSPLSSDAQFPTTPIPCRQVSPVAQHSSGFTLLTPGQAI